VSTHYLIDLFNDDINDVVTPQTFPPSTLITGNYVVRVADDVAVRNPSSLLDLIDKKYQAILGTHGLFTQITYDNLFDATNVNLASSRGIFTGLKGHVGLYPADMTNPVPVLQMDPYGITWGGPGVGPSQALVTYEVFTYVDEDPANAAFQRHYQELPPDVDVSVEISFDGGATFLPVQDKALVSVPISSRGTQLLLRFTRLSHVDSVARVLIGSWAVLY
jgi:hypothetical protein